MLVRAQDKNALPEVHLRIRELELPSGGHIHIISNEKQEEGNASRILALNQLCFHFHRGSRQKINKKHIDFHFVYTIMQIILIFVCPLSCGEGRTKRREGLQVCVGSIVCLSRTWHFSSDF